MINVLLRQAYAFHRADGLQKYRGFARSASNALKLARNDIAAGRHPWSNGPYAKPVAPVCWQADNKARERLAWVDNAERIGLRFVGRVAADSRRGNVWDKRGDSGWYTDPFGDFCKDGTGLMWGVVYQLPARRGVARYVAGYQQGGTEAGPTIDFGTIYESSVNYSDGSPTECDAARNAAAVADSMARIAAEKEREYQTAWQAGNLYSECLENLKAVRASVLGTLRDIRATCDALKAMPESIRARLSGSIKADLAERARLFGTMEELAAGDFEGLEFWTGDATLQAAFNEAAGRDVL